MTRVRQPCRPCRLAVSLPEGPACQKDQPIDTTKASMACASNASAPAMPVSRIACSTSSIDIDVDVDFDGLGKAPPPVAPALTAWTSMPLPAAAAAAAAPSTLSSCWPAGSAASATRVSNSRSLKALSFMSARAVAATIISRSCMMAQYDCACACGLPPAVGGTICGVGLLLKPSMLSLYAWGKGHRSVHVPDGRCTCTVLAGCKRTASPRPVARGWGARMLLSLHGLNPLASPLNSSFIPRFVAASAYAFSQPPTARRSHTLQPCSAPVTHWLHGVMSAACSASSSCCGARPGDAVSPITRTGAAAACACACAAAGSVGSVGSGGGGMKQRTSTA